MANSQTTLFSIFVFISIGILSQDGYCEAHYDQDRFGRTAISGKGQVRNSAERLINAGYTEETCRNIIQEIDCKYEKVIFIYV